MKILIGTAAFACLMWVPVLAQTSNGPPRPAPGVADPDDAVPALVAGAPPPPAAPEVITRNEAGQATVRATRLGDTLVIDGALEESVYQTVASISGFIQVEPAAGEPASESTEAWVFFDDSNIYVAARLWDSAPESRWVVNEMRRDSFNILNNENVSFAFDTFYDRRNVVIFNITPIGGRMDGQGTNERNWNGDWNPIWEVRTGRFEGGWSFEARVPFKSLQYRPGRRQVWGFQMRRQVRWKNESSYLTRLDRALAQMGVFQASQAASLVGLEVPRAGRPFEIKPYAIGDVASDRTATPTVTNDPGGNIGIDVIKYGLTQNLTADFTVNTDFAQVEADEQQVNLTRFSLFFPEKREFFLENQGTFAFGTGGGFGPGGGSADAPILFYSRQIGLYGGREVPIRGGGRLTGRTGAFTLGLLNIHSGDEPTSGAPRTGFTVARLKRDVLRRSSIGAIFTHRSESIVSPGDGSNQAYGVDATFAFYDNLSINGYWARTQTTGLSGSDSSYSGQLRYNGDRYGASAEHLFVDKLFSPEVGFVRRHDMRKNAGSLRFSPRPASIRAIRKFSWEGTFNYITDVSGVLETRDGTGLFGIEFENSDRFQLSHSNNYDFLKQPFLIAPDIVIPVGGYDFHNTQVGYSFGAQRRVSGNVLVEHGTFYDGTKTTLTAGRGGQFPGRIEVTPRVSVEPGLSLNWVALPQGSFTATLVTTRTTYTMTPLMFVSALVQYNSSNTTLGANVRLRWEYQPGSELFVVYNEGRDTLTPRGFPELENRSFIVKVNRLFRF
jgi:hypothetical protein